METALTSVVIDVEATTPTLDVVRPVAPDATFGHLVPPCLGVITSILATLLPVEADRIHRVTTQDMDKAITVPMARVTTLAMEAILCRQLAVVAVGDAAQAPVDTRHCLHSLDMEAILCRQLAVVAVGDAAQAPVDTRHCLHSLDMACRILDVELEGVETICLLVLCLQLVDVTLGGAAQVPVVIRLCLHS